MVCFKFLEAVFHKIYLVHSWILCLIYSYLLFNVSVALAVTNFFNNVTDLWFF